MTISTEEKGKKDCLFQYATRHKVFEDTGLITREEADELAERYLDDCKDRWDEINSPQLCIWINCKSSVDYHTEGLDIDFRDCILEGGHFYRVKKELLK